ncbi:hypothetical protein EON80_11205, partial [bacterium]
MRLQLNSIMTKGMATSSFALVLASCSTTTAQNVGQEGAIVRETQVKANLGSVKKVGVKLPRALWVWDATVITNPKQQKDLFDFCAVKGISVVYASVGDVFQPTKREDTDPKHVTAARPGTGASTEIPARSCDHDVASRRGSS